MKRSSRRYAVAPAAAMLALSVLGGCASTPPQADNSNVRMHLWASNTRIVVGDTTTLSIQNENAAGRGARFDWTADGARLEQFESGRVVHVTYQKAGDYTVTGTMTLQDGTRRADSKTITVERVP